MNKLNANKKSKIKLIPKQQYGGTSPTIFLYDQAKKTMSDEYKANKQAYDLYLQQGYKNPMSFQDFIKSQNKYIGEINQDTKNKKNLVDKVLHAGEYGDSGKGPSIHNIITMGDNPLIDIAGYFAPYLGPAKALVNLTSSEGIPKTVNHLKNTEYLDATLSGLGDAFNVAFVGSAKPLVKKKLTEVVKKYPEKAGKISKPLATKLILDDAIETGTTQLVDGTVLFTNPDFSSSGVLRRVTSPREIDATIKFGTWTDPKIVKNYMPLSNSDKIQKYNTYKKLAQDPKTNPVQLNNVKRAYQFAKNIGDNHGVFGTYNKGTFYLPESFGPGTTILEFPVQPFNLIRSGKGGRGYSQLTSYDQTNKGATAYFFSDWFNPAVSTELGNAYVKHYTNKGWSVVPMADQSHHFIDVKTNLPLSKEYSKDMYIFNGDQTSIGSKSVHLFGKTKRNSYLNDYKNSLNVIPEDINNMESYFNKNYNKKK